jgi:hypothetical protein
MYPMVLRWISEGKLIIDANGQILHDQISLDNPIQFGA